MQFNHRYIYLSSLNLTRDEHRERSLECENMPDHHEGSARLQVEGRCQDLHD